MIDKTEKIEWSFENIVLKYTMGETNFTIRHKDYSPAMYVPDAASLWAMGQLIEEYFRIYPEQIPEMNGKE